MLANLLDKAGARPLNIAAMRIPFLSRNFLGVCYFGGGGGGSGPAQPMTPAAPAVDSAGAKAKVSANARRRVGGMDALSGNVLGDLRQQGKTPTLGGTGTYTGEA